MKSIAIFGLVCFFMGCAARGQELIDLSTQVVELETTIDAGKIKVNFINAEAGKQYKIVALVQQIDNEPLSITASMPDEESVRSVKAEVPMPKLEFRVLQGQMLQVTVSEVDSEKKIVRKYRTLRKGKWQATFGFNMVWLDAETYYSDEQEDSTYIIQASNREKDWDYYPSIMFTWNGFKHMNNKDFNVGLSAGLGYDLQKSFSVFSGISLVYNQNISFHVGAAFVNQKKLATRYNEGDVLNENLEFEQLHEDFLGIRPFVSISFRLDKSPF